MDEIVSLQNWYKSQCDGAREHHYGISIESCDNPGWWVKIDLAGTSLDGKAFDPVARNVSPAQIERIAAGLEADHGRGPDWMLCEVKGNVFSGAGDPDKLQVILETFLAWAKAS
jgi:hypothetical protein